MTPDQNKKKSFFSEWLEKLQQESWQLELLISGFALIGIWESSSLIRRFEYYVQVNGIETLDFYLRVFIVILWAGWALFLVNLLLHIIIRGLWIGAIGLRYVSGDIDYDQLRFSDSFTDFFTRRIGSFDDYIERLERLSSVLFSYTFLLFFMTVSFVLANLFFVICAGIINYFFPTLSTGSQSSLAVLGVIYYGLGLLVLIDFFTLGAFKKIREPAISKIYLYIYRFYSAISLSFVYRPLLFNFIDDRYTRKLFYLAIPYGLIIVIGFGQTYLERYAFIPDFSFRASHSHVISSNSFNWRYYDDLRINMTGEDRPYRVMTKQEKIEYVSMESYEVSGPLLKIFLEYRRDDGQLVQSRYPDLEPFRKTGLRNKILSRRIRDPRLRDLSAAESREILFMREVIRNPEKKQAGQDTTTFYKGSSYYQQFTRDDIESLQREISSYYRELRNAYMTHKIETAKRALLDLYEVQLNSTAVTDSLDCRFFVHPNLGEKGMLCYLDISDLDVKSHVLDIIKINYREDCGENCPKRYFQVPFVKIN